MVVKIAAGTFGVSGIDLDQTICWRKRRSPTRRLNPVAHAIDKCTYGYRTANQLTDSERSRHLYRFGSMKPGAGDAATLAAVGGPA